MWAETASREISSAPTSAALAPYGLPDFSTFNTSTSDLANGVTLVESSSFLHNYIGTDSRADATDPLGWSDLAERNIISATGQGLHITGYDTPDPTPFPAVQNNVIAGNFIGTDVHGTTALGNWAGISLQGGTHDDLVGTDGDGVNDTGERNVISGNQAGLVLNGIGATIGCYRRAVAGNWIGIDANGNPMGNLWGGVTILSVVLDLRIGGTAPVLGNIIANSGISAASLHYVLASNGSPYLHAPGVWIFTQPLPSPTNVTVQGNSIYGNAGLGIDLGGSYPPPTSDGVTVNDPLDADYGPNNLQNYPILSSVASSATHARVTGTLASTANTFFTLDFYASTAADFGGDQITEGRRYLGSGSVTTNASGIGVFDSATFTTLLGASTPDEWITATATDPAGNTSEFSPGLRDPRREHRRAVHRRRGPVPGAERRGHFQPEQRHPQLLLGR